MMAARVSDPGLMARLPPVRGRLTENASLANVTWFRVGGPAEIMYRPADAADLAQFLAEKPADVPVTVIGVGSNLLVRDGGIPGVVIRLGREFAVIETGDAAVAAGAAALDLNVARAACETGIAGLEFFAGIPGTVGGALRMNAGAYGAEVKDVLVSAEALDGRGRTHRLGAADFAFAYRSTCVPEDWIFLRATFAGRTGDSDSIARRIREIARTRKESQPVRSRTGGSTFKNPPGESAWRLIDEAGCRGLRVGGAMVSEMHCNFLINTGDATAADLETLGEEVRRRVRAATGISLEWEIKRVGVPAPGVAGRERA